MFSAEVDLILLHYFLLEKNSAWILRTVTEALVVTFELVMKLPTNQQSPESLLKPLTLRGNTTRKLSAVELHKSK